MNSAATMREQYYYSVRMNSDNCLMYNKSMWFYCSCVEKKKKKEEGNGEIENVDVQ